MFTIDQIKTHLRAIPLPLRFGAGGFIVLLLVLLLFAPGSGPAGTKLSHPAPSPRVAVQPAPVIAPAVAHPIAPIKAPVAPAMAAPTPTAASASSPAAAMTTVTPASLMLPAQAEPANLVRGTSTRMLSAAPASANFTEALPTDWTSVATVTEQTPTASWSTAPGKALQALDPSNGFVSNTWTAWIRVANAGAHTLVLRLNQGPTRSTTVTIDSGASPAITATRNGCSGDCGQATTTMATATLAAGWHQVTVQVIQKATDAATAADLYVRGPSDSMPIAVVPFAPAAKSMASQVSP
ncbi:hypothetical protein [Rhodanobacter aciditrophus]|uniref:hypothetical protein n=1 Tax=Rhodanobacter aciditrophus TaxID=1623218 RepID=UPI003CF91A2D